MKIMMFAPYIYDSDMKEFTRNKTGFGIMVKNILVGVSEITDVVLVTRVITEGCIKQDGKYKILSHTWKQVITQARICDWKQAISKLIYTKGSFKEKARQAFYCIDEGYIRKQLINQKPDIVHIHGIGSITKNCINACEKLGISYIITLHGLIGLNDSINASKSDKKMEFDILKSCFEKNIFVSVVSTGIKRRIEKNYLNQNSKNIKVITNGTNMIQRKINKKKIDLSDFNETDYLERYHQDLISGDCPEIDETYKFLVTCKNKGKKIIISVGNLTDNKNQIELVEATKKLNVDKEVIIVLFGNEMDNQKVRKKIIESKLENSVVFAGFCNELDRFWELADLNVLLSINEGFGLSIIEGYIYGVPSVTFYDLDAAKDIYDINSTILIRKREISAVIDAIRLGLELKWDSEKIKEVGKRFSLQKIVKQYLNLYSEQLGEEKW